MSEKPKPGFFDSVKSKAKKVVVGLGLLGAVEGGLAKDAKAEGFQKPDLTPHKLEIDRSQGGMREGLRLVLADVDAMQNPELSTKETKVVKHLGKGGKTTVEYTEVDGMLVANVTSGSGGKTEKRSVVIGKTGETTDGHGNIRDTHGVVGDLAEIQAQKAVKEKIEHLASNP
jgi:hypothetical protein